MASLEDRFDRAVSRLLRGGRVGSRRPAHDLERLSTDEDRAAMMMAAELAGAREGMPRMSPAFRRRLAEQLRDERRPFTRRAALTAAAGLVAGVAGGFAIDRAAGGKPSDTPVPGPLVRPAPGTWVPVAALARLPEGVPVRVLAGDGAAYVLRTGSSVRAISGLCSDMPCALEARTAEYAAGVYCPCHRAEFDFEGNQVGRSGGPAWPPLKTYPARIEGGVVQLRLG